MKVSVGDLLFLKDKIDMNIQGEDLDDLSIGMVLSIQEADGSEEHQEIIFETYKTFNEIENVDQLVNSTQIKVVFPRTQKQYWFPEFYIQNLFKKNKEKT